MVDKSTTPDASQLGPAAVGLYKRVAIAGSLPRQELVDGDDTALQALFDCGLIQEDPDAGGLVAVDPASVQASVAAPLGQRGAALLRAASEWSQALDELAKSFREINPGQPFTEVRGLDNINLFIDAKVRAAREELLTAQPTVGRSEGALDRATERDIAAVQRGVSMRTLYQHSARRSVPLQSYVDAISQHGATVRTLDEFFKRLIVIDRGLAVVPGTDPDENVPIAMAITQPALVNYLVDIFEKYWERAQPFEDRQESTNATIANDVRNMTIRMLAEGHSDPASAKRMGVSTRTYAGYIASLKDEYDSRTRFQLGYAMGLEDGRLPEPPQSEV